MARHENFTLRAEQREILGSQVNALRRSGSVPVVVYGPKTRSQPLQVDARELSRVIQQAGGTRIIHLQVDGARSAHTVLAREVQRHPVRHDILHVDFLEVALDQPIRAMVPVVLGGKINQAELPGAYAQQLLNEVEVEALPADLVPQFTVDVSGLAGAHAAIYVRDLHADNVTILTAPDEMVVHVAIPVAEAEEVEEVEIEPSVEAEGEPSAAATED
jgi:large subunit ribosomal protein L25